MPFRNNAPVAYPTNSPIMTPIATTSSNTPAMTQRFHLSHHARKLWLSLSWGLRPLPRAIGSSFRAADADDSHSLAVDELSCGKINVLDELAPTASVTLDLAP